LEILACPHCERLFRTTPAVFGKKIRCRGCRQTFHVPKDTSDVPLGPSVDGLGKQDNVPPTAIACVVDDRDARRCPECGRTFAMKAALVGKTIRCRGCKAPFRVGATLQSPAGPVASVGNQGRAPVAPSPSVPATATSSPRPTIFEDIGDILDEIIPGERVASVVRPQNAAAPSRAEANPFYGLIAVAFGGLCAIPTTQLILWWVLGKDPLRLASSLPDVLRWIVPPHMRP